MQENWEKLRGKLLQEGGGFVVRPNAEPDLDLLLAKGQAREGERETVEGQTGLCHQNVARGWRRGEGDIFTGYALSKDGGWRQHSWLESKGSIKETAGQPREAYWGAKVEDAKSWSKRQLRRWRWWQVIGWALLVATIALTAYWIAAGAPVPEALQ